jgi:ankyrin repeat protein
MLLDFLSNSGKLESSLQAAFYLDSKIHSDIDARRGVYGLHMAAFYGLDPAITDLVDTKGIPVDSIDPKYGQTALMYACRRGHITTVTKLLDLGASVNVRSARETTAFLEAYLQHSET